MHDFNFNMSEQSKSNETKPIKEIRGWPILNSIRVKKRPNWRAKKLKNRFFHPENLHWNSTLSILFMYVWLAISSKTLISSEKIPSSTFFTPISNPKTLLNPTYRQTIRTFYGLHIIAWRGKISQLNEDILFH